MMFSHGWLLLQLVHMICKRGRLRGTSMQCSMDFFHNSSRRRRRETVSSCGPCTEVDNGAGEMREWPFSTS